MLGCRTKSRAHRAAGEAPPALALSEIAGKIGARPLTAASAGDPAVCRVFMGDRMSDVLEGAGAETLVVSHLATVHLARAAHLLDVPAVCLAGGVTPDERLVRAAEGWRLALLSTPLDSDEIYGRLSGLLAVRNGMAP